MLNTIRLSATTVLALSLAIAGLTVAAGAPSSLVPQPDGQSTGAADEVLAHSTRHGTVECPINTRNDLQQRADRLATLRMRHSMVSRSVPGRDIAESAGEAIRTAPAQYQDDAPRDCG